MFLNESIVYNAKKVDPGKLRLFIDWLESKSLTYTLNSDTKELEIYNEFELNKQDAKEFNIYLDRLALEKIWENSITTLSNTVGLGAVNPPSNPHDGGQPSLSNSGKGSGDRFDNGSADEDDEDDEEIKKAKKKKKSDKKVAQAQEEKKILRFDSFVNENENTHVGSIWKAGESGPLVLTDKEKEVETFIKKLAKDFGNDVQASINFIDSTIKKMGYKC